MWQSLPKMKVCVMKLMHIVLNIVWQKATTTKKQMALSPFGRPSTGASWHFAGRPKILLNECSEGSKLFCIMLPVRMKNIMVANVLMRWRKRFSLYREKISTAGIKYFGIDQYRYCFDNDNQSRNYVTNHYYRGEITNIESSLRG